MGYSIGVHARSLKLRDEMYDFMQANLRPYGEIVGDKDIRNRYEFSKWLGYIKGKRVVGFNYNCGNEQRDFIYALTAWMAVQIGSKRFCNVCDGANDYRSVHWYNYDSQHTCPVVVMEHKDYKTMLGGMCDVYREIYQESPSFVDKYGWQFCEYPGFNSKFRMSWMRDVDINIRKLLVEETKRLDGLWRTM